MSLYGNLGDTWDPVVRPYINVAGAWAGAKEVWAKEDGTWERLFIYDVQPPSPPELSLTVIDGRYISVGVRQPLQNHDPNLAVIRVLVSPNTTTYPSSPGAANFYSTPTTTYPNEPWSEWRYNHWDGSKINSSAWAGHPDSSVLVPKFWPVNPTSTTDLAGGRPYLFAAYSMDTTGNWSPISYAQITMPKTGDDADLLVKTAKFEPTNAGTWVNDNVFTQGDMEVSYNPNKKGMWYYGGQIAESVGLQGTPTITQAQLYVVRSATDAGPASSNVYVGFGDGTGAAGMRPTMSGDTKVGVLAKGQAAWFNLPTTWYQYFNSQISVIGLWNKDPAKATGNADDILTVKGWDTDTGVRLSGHLRLVWTEKP